jgi:hypothetical protein
MVCALKGARQHLDAGALLGRSGHRGHLTEKLLERGRSSFGCHVGLRVMFVRISTQVQLANVVDAPWVAVPTVGQADVHERKMDVHGRSHCGDDDVRSATPCAFSHRHERC